MGKFTKGNAGKPFGAENKTTKKAKELFLSIMEGEVEHIKTALDELRNNDSAAYLSTLSKFYPYFIPKKLEVDTPEGIEIKLTRKVIKA